MVIINKYSIIFNNRIPYLLSHSEIISRNNDILFVLINIESNHTATK